MLSCVFVFVLGCAGAARALQSSYTGPLFNPSDAAHFDYSSLVLPSQSSLPAIQPTNVFSMATTISGIILPTTMSRDETTASRSETRSVSTAASSSSASETASSSTVGSAVTSASASVPAQQSSAAAVANRAGVVGIVAGGVLAGLAMA